MPLDLDEAVAVLKKTPATLDAWLRGLPDAWIRVNEGPDTWCAYDVVGHLIHGERTDWIPRARILLEHGEKRGFDKFDRFAQFHESQGKPLDELLTTFATLRAKSLADLRDLRLKPADLERRGKHPALGAVTLGQLIATWVTHDLDHVFQIARVMAKRAASDVGPWAQYLRIVSGKPSD